MTNDEGPDRQTGKRAGFVLLFLLGIALTAFMSGLACSIACSGYGFLAVVVFYLGLGLPAAGIYFLGRTTERPIRKLREVRVADRRRAIGRFWRSWLLLIGGFTLLCSS